MPQNLKSMAFAGIVHVQWPLYMLQGLCVQQNGGGVPRNASCVPFCRAGVQQKAHGVRQNPSRAQKIASVYHILPLVY